MVESGLRHVPYSFRKDSFWTITKVLQIKIIKLMFMNSPVSIKLIFTNSPKTPFSLKNYIVVKGTFANTYCWFFSFLSVRFFKLLSSSLLLFLFSQRFGRWILWPSSGFPCLSGIRNDSIWEIISKKDFPEPKRCEKNNKDEDNCPKTLTDKNHQASFQKFRQLILFSCELYYTLVNLLCLFWLILI